MHAAAQMRLEALVKDLDAAAGAADMHAERFESLRVRAATLGKRCVEGVDVPQLPMAIAALHSNASVDIVPALQQEAVELAREVEVARRAVEELGARQGAAAAAASALGQDLRDLENAGLSEAAELGNAVAAVLEKEGPLEATGKEEEPGTEESSAGKAAGGIVERVAKVSETAARIGPLETENTFVHSAAMQLIILLKRVSEDKTAAEVQCLL
jgi:hypothetical protein